MDGDPRRADERLLPARLRRPSVVLSVGCAVVFLALAVRYSGSAFPGRFDILADRALPLVGYPHRWLALATNLAPVAFFFVDAVTAVALLRLRRWRLAALAVVGPALTMLVTEVAKPLIGRTRDGSPCLPSGHTAAVTAVAVVGAVLLVHRMRGRPVLGATLGFLAASALGAAIAIVLVVLGWHFATDTVAGYCVAVATTLAAALALDGIAERRLHSGRSRGEARVSTVQSRGLSR